MVHGAWCMVHGQMSRIVSPLCRCCSLPPTKPLKPVNSQLIKLTKLIKFIKLYIPFLSRQNVLQTVDFTGPR